MKRRKEMAALLARRERDGLSLRALSEEVGIPIGTLAWWSWRLRHGDYREQKRGGFLEIVSEARDFQSSVVVRVGSDIEIEVPTGIDVAWLSSLASALRSC